MTTGWLATVTSVMTRSSVTGYQVPKGCSGNQDLDKVSLLIWWSHPITRGGKVIKPASQPWGGRELFQLVTCADGSARLAQLSHPENTVHSPPVPAAHSPLGSKTSLGAPTLPPPTSRPEANFLLCLKLNEFWGKEQVTFFLPLCISGE